MRSRGAWAGRTNSGGRGRAPRSSGPPRERAARPSRRAPGPPGGGGRGRSVRFRGAGRAPRDPRSRRGRGRPGRAGGRRHRRRQRAVSAADPGTGAPANGQGGTILVFLNEVAGGRKLLEATRERVE